MIDCPFCGRSNQADAAYCSACGGLLNSPFSEQRKKTFKKIIGSFLAFSVAISLLGGAAIFHFSINLNFSNPPSSTPASVSVPQNPYPPDTGMLVLNDPLQDNSKGYGWEWDDTTDSAGGICDFTGQGYRVSMPKQGSIEYCPARNTDFSNFAFEVQMTIIEGDFGGIFFRAASVDSSNPKFYLFYVDQYGEYELALCTGNTCSNLVTTTSSSWITQGLNQPNLIAVVANDDTITLYVNHQQLESVTDSTYSHGQIGLLASPYTDTSNPSDLGHPTDVIYNNARVWTL